MPGNLGVTLRHQDVLQAKSISVVALEMAASAENSIDRTDLFRAFIEFIDQVAAGFLVREGQVDDSNPAYCVT